MTYQKVKPLYSYQFVTIGDEFCTAVQLIIQCNYSYSFIFIQLFSLYSYADYTFIVLNKCQSRDLSPRGCQQRIQIFTMKQINKFYDNLKSRNGTNQLKFNDVNLDTEVFEIFTFQLRLKKNHPANQKSMWDLYWIRQAV